MSSLLLFLLTRGRPATFNDAHEQGAQFLLTDEALSDLHSGHRDDLSAAGTHAADDFLQLPHVTRQSGVVPHHYGSDVALDSEVVEQLLESRLPIKVRWPPHIDVLPHDGQPVFVGDALTRLTLQRDSSGVVRMHGTQT
nr:hypothetical protein [Saccharothrix sp. 6-C]